MQETGGFVVGRGDDLPCEQQAAAGRGLGVSRGVLASVCFLRRCKYSALGGALLLE